MGLELEPRQHSVIGETVKRVERTPTGTARFQRPSYESRGVDFGTVIVPRTTITARTKTVQAGSDDWTPGVGTAYLFKTLTGGPIEPWLDSVGAVIFRTVYNLSSQSFSANNPPPTTDYIGGDTSILFASMDRTGKLFIPADDEGVAAGTTKFAMNDGTAIPAAVGTTPGTRVVDIWEFSNGALAVSSPLEQVTAYNWQDYVVPANELFVLHKELASGRWIVHTDGEQTIEGFSAGTDGSETLYPYDTLKIVGDGDSGSGMIDVTISKATDVVTVNIDATDPLFTITDIQSPTPGTANIDFGDDLDLSTSIDESQTTIWSQWKVTDVASDPAADLVFGKVFDVTGDTGDVDIFPIETLKFVGGTVSKAASTVTVTISAAAYTFTIDGDLGATAVVNSADTVLFEGTIPAGAMAPDVADRGIVTNIVNGGAIDQVEISVDVTVHQTTLLSGTGATAPFQVDISGGTRNELGLISNKASTIDSVEGTPTGSKGWIELQGNAAGTVEFILHEQVSDYSFTIGGNVGAAAVIDSGDTVLFEGTVPSPASGMPAAADRGIITNVVDGGAADEVEIAVDESVLQKITLTGNGTTGTTPVLVSAGSRNTIDITSTTTAGANVEDSYVQVDGGAGTFELIMRRDGKVRVRSGDAIGYLETQFTDWITDADADRFKSAEDPLVEFQTDPIVVGTEQLRGFINSSDITGYSASGELHLSLDSNVLKWMAPSAAITFTVAGDTGSETISGGDTLTIEGSALQAAVSPGDRGIRTTAVAVDTVELSVDETVMQKVDLQGTATTGTDPVLISAGTRNQLNLISNISSTVDEITPRGYIEVKGDPTGGIELILHEQATSSAKMAQNQGSAIGAFNEGTDTPGTGTVDIWEFTNGSIADTTTPTTVYNYSSFPVPANERIMIRREAGDNRFIVDMDGQQTIEDGDGSQETLFPYETFKFRGDRDVSSTLGNIINIDVTKAADIITVDVDATGDMFRFADDDSPQAFARVGLGEDVTLANAIDETMTTKFSEYRVTEPGGLPTITQHFGKVFDVTGDTGDVDIFPLETLKFVGGTVSKAADTVTVTVTGTFIFTVDGDLGATAVVNSGDTLLFEGTIPAGVMAPSVAERGIVTNIVSGGATDQVEISVDASVMQEVLLNGSGTSGDVMIPVENGTRNQIRITSTTTPGGNVENSYVEVNGTAGAGDIELIMRRDGKVRVRSGDTVDYLEDQFVDWITDADADPFKSAEDPLVEMQTQGAVGFEQLRGFINSSDITGYSATGELHLGLDTNVLKWIVPQHTIEDGDGSTELLFNNEKLLVRGDRDISSTLGNIINVDVIKAAGVVTLTVDATGDMFRFADDDSPQAFGRVGLGEDVTLANAIDETMTTKFSEYRITEPGGLPTITQHFGKVFDVTGDTGSVDIFPLEELNFVGATVTKPTADKVTVTISAAAYTFTIDGDLGGTAVIDNSDTLLFEGTVPAGAMAPLVADRGIVTNIVSGGAIDEVRISVDASVMQKVDLQGTAKTGTDPVLISAGVRNQLNLISNTGSTIEETGSKGWIEISGDPTGGIELILHEQKMHFGSPKGAIIMGRKAPITGTAGRKFIDRNNVADEDWALMDGTSNTVSSPIFGSGIDMADHFVRGQANANLPATGAHFGRDVAPTPDLDEVTIEDHDDHTHQILGLAGQSFSAGSLGICGFFFGGEGCDVECTSDVRDVANCVLAETNGVLGHILTNHQGSTSNKIHMTPPNRNLHFYERVAE